MKEQFEKWVMVASSGNADLTLNIHGEYDSPETSGFYELYKLARTDIEQQLAAVVAENAGLRAGIQAAFEEMESHHDTDGLYSYDADGEQMDALIRLCDAQGEISDLLDTVKNPATDAYLAEVRAQGVEMYADNLDSSADDAERDGFDDAVKFLRSESSGVRLFAAQLRKGAAL
ncbi:hypothetical protein [Salmonella enterica]|uniref:hypothetical protein n=1 Tax=Salmonella enterica TaxID=28901 RepID=UPI001F504475|nr:hypothetical protein [Salmonella enterica]